ncbi:MAG: ABC transporter substrate-binding protein [Acidimicrobiia bacterium]|nr:ABC transporter substrate-binding protein [Acidimicrobiia bacterium]
MKRFIRKPLTWAALLAAFAMVAAACGDTGSTETTTAQTSPPATEAPTSTAPPATEAPATTAPAFQKPYGGEVFVASDQEPPTLNTFAPGGDNFIVSIIGQSYWVGVQDIDGFTLELIPDLVTELPTVANGGITVNADGTETVRYQIRDEAVWADGTPISGDDFQFTYDTIMDPDLPILKATYEDIVSTTAGPKTFEYTLSAPTVQAELIFGTILPKHDVEDSDFINDWNDTMWVSGGPFEFDAWQKGEFVKVVRNENFWKTDAETGQQLPYLDSVVFRFIPETASLINAFKAREVDVINPPPSIETIEDLQTLTGEGASVEVLSGPIWEHMFFTFGDGRLQRNPDSYNEFLEYRKAVAHAIDKQKIVDEILKGQVEPLDSFVDAFSPTLSQASWAQYDYDPAKAAGFIDDLCARDDTDCDATPVKAIFSTTSNNDARVTLSELFVTMFEDAGIAYEAQLEDSSLYFGETLDFAIIDVGEFAWVGTPGFAGLISILDVWDPEAPPPDGSNYYRWGTPEVTGADPDGFNQGASVLIDENTTRFAEIRDAMNATVDTDELVALLNEAENILADQVVIIPLYARLDPGAVWADEVAGYKHNPSQAGDTWNIEEWYRVDL